MIMRHPNVIPRRGAQITIKEKGHFGVSVNTVDACPTYEKISRVTSAKLEEPRDTGMGFLKSQKVIAVGKRPNIGKFAIRKPSPLTKQGPAIPRPEPNGPVRASTLPRLKERQLNW